MHGSEALQRAVRPYVYQIQQEYMEILEEKGSTRDIAAKWILVGHSTDVRFVQVFSKCNTNETKVK